MFRDIKPITLIQPQSLNLRLWDEELKKLVGYSHLREPGGFQASGPALKAGGRRGKE